MFDQDLSMAQDMASFDSDLSKFCFVEGSFFADKISALTPFSD